MKIFLLAATVATFSSTVLADDFSYKGVKLGDPIEVVKEKLPTYECSSTSCNYSMRLCITNKSRNDCDSSASLAGQWIEFGFIKIRDKKVSSIYLETPKNYMQGVADAVAEAYGNPASSESKEVKTKSGAVHSSWRKTWSRGDQNLRLDEIASNINTGSIIITSKQEEAAATEERQNKAKAGAKDF